MSLRRERGHAGSKPTFFHAEWSRLCSSGDDYFADWIENDDAFDPITAGGTMDAADALDRYLLALA